MQTQISEMVGEFETGRISRRELVRRLTVFAAASAGLDRSVLAAEEASTFEALNINHIALRVTDVERSRELYKKHLGMQVIRQTPGRQCFLRCGPNHFVALFKSDQPRMDHYCYSIKNYDQRDASRKLKSHGLAPEMPPHTNRIYFKDPDGLKVQLSAIDHSPG